MSTNDKSADKEPGKNAINETMLDDEFSLEAQKAPLSAAVPKNESPRKSSPGNNNKGQSSEVISSGMMTNAPTILMWAWWIPIRMAWKRGRPGSTTHISIPR